MTGSFLYDITFYIIRQEVLPPVCFIKDIHGKACKKRVLIHIEIGNNTTKKGILK